MQKSIGFIRRNILFILGVLILLVGGALVFGSAYKPKERVWYGSNNLAQMSLADRQELTITLNTDGLESDVQQDLANNEHLIFCGAIKNEDEKSAYTVSQTLETVPRGKTFSTNLPEQLEEIPAGYKVFCGIQDPETRNGIVQVSMRQDSKTKLEKLAEKLDIF